MKEKFSEIFHLVCFRVCAWVLSWSTVKLWVQVKLLGLPKNVPEGPYILVSNHISHFEPHLIGHLYPRKIDFMADREFFFSNWIGRLFCWGCDIFPVNRDTVDTSAVREALRRLKKGRIIGVFPEGGIRSGKESVLEGKMPGMGAVTLAQMAGVPIRVCMMIGADQLYCWKNLFRRLPVYFKYGPELKLDSSLSNKEARKKMNEEMGQVFQKMYREFLEEIKPPLEVLPATAQERWKRGK